jgi:1-acyl-sn-glycerol-3-phosphate acyltransferase
MGEVIDPTGSDVFVSWLPLYHDMGLIGAWLGSLHYGVPLVVISPLRFLVRPERWLWAIHRHRGTLSAAPNFAFELCLRKIEDEAIAGLDLSSLRMVANGAEPVSAETIRNFTNRFARYGFRPEAMAPVYGLAENAVGLAFPPLGRLPLIDRIGRRALGRERRAVPVGADDADSIEFVACGRPLPGHQVRIRGLTGELGEREEGQLQFRGPSAASGYFANPEKNRELFDGEWLNSGDLAYIAGGEVFVTGRSKDIIIRAGQHIYPQEVEEAVGEVAGVRKGCVAVFGISDPVAGTERVVILAETRETDPDRVSELRSRIEGAAAQLLQAPPEEIVLVPPHTVPKTSSGKVRRAAARRLYEQGEPGAKRHALWRQFVPLALSGLMSQVRTIGRATGEFAYAGYWWTTIALVGALAWPLVLAIPAPSSRWAMLHRLARVALRMLGIGVSTELAAPLPKHGVLVSNHASYFDGLVLSAVLPGELAFVAKKELEPQRVAGTFLRALGTLFVERSDPAAGVNGAREALSAARAGRRLIVFPEGTFSRAPGLLPFHLGAFSVAATASLPVVPVAIRGTRSLLRGGQWFPRRRAVQVYVGAPIVPGDRDFDAVLRLRDATRAAILAHCGEPEAVEP